MLCKNTLNGFAEYQLVVHSPNVVNRSNDPTIEAILEVDVVLYSFHISLKKNLFKFYFSVNLLV